MTILEELQNANLPVISATEEGQISMGAMTDEEKALFEDIVLQYFQPVEYQTVQELRTFKQDVRDEYQNAVTNLEQIRDAPSMTQAEAIQAIQYMAKVLLLVLKVFRRII